MLASFYRQSNSQNPHLRIGLLLDSDVLPRCFAEVIDDIQQSNFARLELLIFNAEDQPTPNAPAQPRSLAQKVIRTLRDPQLRKKVLYTLYDRWDGRHVDPASDPLAMVNCCERFKQVERMSVVPERKRYVHRFPPAAIAQIRNKNLDVILRFGFNILRGDILYSAKYGIWSYHHGDGDFFRGGPAHFWEVLEANPISGVMLQVLTEELDAGKVLCKGLFATYPGISRARNLVQPYWGATSFVIQKLHELHQYGWDHLERKASIPATYQGRKRIYTTPTNMEMSRWLVPVLIRKATHRLVRRPTIKHWRLAIRNGASRFIDSGLPVNLTGFQQVESPKGSFYADPFLMEEGGKTWAFFEDYDYAAERGRISCSEVTGTTIGPAVRVLERPYHLSYPCVFRDREELYMIPETESNSTVELYRCTRFPDRWKLEKVLFTARAVDTTVFIDEGRYWFFVTLQDPRGLGMQLWLFSSNELTGEWTCHPANPLSMDVRNARGGGAIFRSNSKLYRPSQNCGQHYGYSFTLNEVTVLDSARYEEKPSVTVAPSWAPGLVATHTYSRLGSVEVIDGCTPLPIGRVV